MSKTSHNSAIERSPEIQEHVGVQLEGLSALFNPDLDWVEVRGQLRSTTGNQLAGDVAVVAAIHDEEGRVIGSQMAHFFRDEFFGIGTVDIAVEVPSPAIAKVHVYPTRS